MLNILISQGASNSVRKREDEGGTRGVGGWGGGGVGGVRIHLHYDCQITKALGWQRWKPISVYSDLGNKSAPHNYVVWLMRSHKLLPLDPHEGI